MKEIPLTRGMVAIVDDEDFDLVMQHKWHAKPYSNKPHVYVAATNVRVNGVWTVRKMHRMILTVEDAIQVDHRNRNSLDNRRQNLRSATRFQNSQNRGPFATSHIKYKGVSRSRDRYQAGIQANGKRIYLGRFSTAEIAAKAYDAKAIEMHGEFAVLNFPQELTA